VAPSSLPTSAIYRGIIPFVVLQMIGIAILFIFPQIVTWLPKVL
jgi:TRAP-type mannitol/chloroaromatic compound transport system permease large subunit